MLLLYGIRNTEFQFHIYKGSQIIPIKSQINLILIVTSIYLIFILILFADNGLFVERFLLMF